MILTKTVKFKLNQFNSHHFKRLGYEVEGKDEIDVKIEDVGKGSMIRIDVKCDLCGKEKKIGYRKYFKNFNKYSVYSCSNKCSMFKNERTNLIKYGFKHQCQNEDVQNNILNTKIERGLMSVTIEEYKDYRRIVDNLTKRVRREILENWDGFDHYDGEYIRDNMNLDSNNPLYPSIDHKISVLYGYQKGLTPEHISDKENLCVTKRCLNSSKNFKIEDVFKKTIQSH